MIDLETLDTVATSAILSIGAVECDIITGETGLEFNRIVDLKDQVEKGFTISSETLYWWLMQSEGARSGVAGADVKKEPIYDALVSFCKFIDNCTAAVDNIRIWSNGASFDIPILAHAFKKHGWTMPGAFWNHRDMRTLVGFMPFNMRKAWMISNQRPGTYHNALDDAKYQVKYCSYILQELGVKEIY